MNASKRRLRGGCAGVGTVALAGDAGGLRRERLTMVLGRRSRSSNTLLLLVEGCGRAMVDDDSASQAPAVLQHVACADEAPARGRDSRNGALVCCNGEAARWLIAHSHVDVAARDSSGCTV